MERQCLHCERNDNDVRLEKCPICFKFFCFEHSHSRSGRRFCSPACAQFYFFGDDEDVGSGEE